MSLHYQSDVRALSDEELKTLSTEIEEAYQREGEEYSYFTDSEAETRYYEMQAELRRRWDEANPEEAKRRLELAKTFCGDALRIMADNNAHMAQQANRLYDAEFFSGAQWPKIGDTITVRKPERFNG